MLTAVTNAGRRVIVAPMTGVQERWLLDGSNNPVENLSINKRLIQTLVRNGLDQPLANDDVQNEMFVGEQVHLLYLIRIASLGPIYDFRQTHKGCKPKKYSIDLRHATIQVLRCADQDCNCQLYDGRRTITELTDTEPVHDLSDIPEGHYEAKSPMLETVLPISRKTIQYRLMRVKDQANAVRLVQEHDPGAITKLLELMTVSIDGDASSLGKRRHEIFWEKAASQDRLYMRSVISKNGLGVDTKVNMTCQQCRAQFMARFEMGSSDFWIPDPAE